jgi:CRISPR-associated protein Cas1
MIDNTNRTHIIASNKLIKRKSNNLDLYSLDKNGEVIKGDRTYIPLNTIDEIYILNKCLIDTETLAFLADNNILIHFHSRNQRHIGSFYPNSNKGVNKSGFVFLQQLRAFDDDVHRIYLAKQITFGHLSGLQRNLKQYNIESKMDEKINQLASAKTITEIMGIEGSAKKEYFSLWNQIIKDQKNFKFIQRSKRPPADKINVLISYLNSRIYNICLSEIYKTELDPRISFLHEPNHRGLSLHLDIAEIFKPIISDKIIFTLLNKKMLKSSDFKREKGLWKLERSGLQIIEMEIIKKLSSVRFINGMKMNFRFVILREINQIKKSIVEFSEYIPYDDSS